MLIMIFTIIIQIFSVNCMFVKTDIKNCYQHDFSKNCFIPDSVLKKQFYSSLFMFFF